MRVGEVKPGRVPRIGPAWWLCAVQCTSLAGLLCLPASAQDPPATTLRVDAQLVNLFVNVTDKKGRPISDMTIEEFKVFEDGKRQELTHFTRETDRPLTLALLFDTSISQKEILDVERQAALLFLEEVMQEKDLAILVTFDVNVDLVQDFTADTERLGEGLRRARINAPVPFEGPVPRTGPIGTRLYDAIYLASKQKLQEEVGRKALILLTDGYDAGSDSTEREAIASAHKADAIIFAIGIAEPSPYGPGQTAYVGARALRHMAEETGGRAFFPHNPEELQRAFAMISLQLRTQYLLSYSPANRVRDGRFRKIKVKVSRKKTRTRARKGYYAPGLQTDAEDR